MAEISNTVLAVLVVAALVVVVAGTVLNLNGGITGFATTGTGNVSLTINQTLAIEVNNAFDVIDFGTCSPRAGSSYWCATNDTMGCDGVNVVNCTGDAISNATQYLRVDNVGNVDANVNLSSSCTASTLIGGTSPLLQFITTDCNGTAVSSWTSFTGATQAACTNVSYLGGAMRMYANVTIPFNAMGSGCAGNTSIITFTATTAS